MGGPGSGEWLRILKRPTTEEYFSLDIREVARLELLPEIEASPLNVTYTQCNFGGRRPWWLCPGCSRRVAILYKRSEKFRCRHCHDLVHSSRQLGKLDRAFGQLRKARRRIGSDWHQKPKGMHWSTFRRLAIQVMEAERQACSEFLGWAQKGKSDW
jgi:hypothetical protein